LFVRAGSAGSLAPRSTPMADPLPTALHGPKRVGAANTWLDRLLCKHDERITVYMSENRVTKKSGRPVGAKGLLPAMAVIAIRLPTDLIDQIDEWGAERGMTRSQSIRRWLENGVDEHWKPTKKNPASPATRAHAATLAAEALDRHTDQSAAPGEQASRKRKLLKGPKEFRDIRKDHKRQ